MMVLTLPDFGAVRQGRHARVELEIATDVQADAAHNELPIYLRQEEREAPSTKPWKIIAAEPLNLRRRKQKVLAGTTERQVKYLLECRVFDHPEDLDRRLRLTPGELATTPVFSIQAKIRVDSNENVFDARKCFGSVGRPDHDFLSPRKKVQDTGCKQCSHR